MPPSWPDDAYLLSLGRVVYSIASLEGGLIFDLPRLPECVPGLTAEALAGATTTTIGKLLVQRGSQLQDPQWRSYLVRGGDALSTLGPRRNSVLHARPATIDGAQRLHRWRLAPTEVEDITDDVLEALLSEIESHRAVVNSLRPPLPN